MRRLSFPMSKPTSELTRGIKILASSGNSEMSS